MGNFRVVASNCGCCAVKHIRDFTHRPDNTFFYLDSDGGHDEEQSSSTPEPYENWAQPLAEKPANAGDAFRAIVAQIKHRRPAGLITCNLVTEEEDHGCDGCDGWDGWDCGCDGENFMNSEQPDAWRPIMTELGFSETTFPNSNSGNIIHHFTLAYDEGGWEA